MKASAKGIQRIRDNRRACSFSRSARKSRYSDSVAARSSRQCAVSDRAFTRACSTNCFTIASFGAFSAGVQPSASQRAASIASSFGFRAMPKDPVQNRLALIAGKIMFAGQARVKQFQFRFDCLNGNALGVRSNFLHPRQHGQFFPRGDNLDQIRTMDTPVFVRRCLQDHRLISRCSKFFNSIKPANGLLDKVFTPFGLVATMLLRSSPDRLPSIRYGAHAGKVPAATLSVKASFPVENFSTTVLMFHSVNP